MVKRRVVRLRATGLVDRSSEDREATYRASEWLCGVAGILATASRWELRHEAGARLPARREVEAAFLLAAPLVKLPASASGTCALAVAQPREDGETEIAGVQVAAERERLLVYELQLEPSPATWVLGTVEGWMQAVIDGDMDDLRINGAQVGLARIVVKGLHQTLFCGQ